MGFVPAFKTVLQLWSRKPKVHLKLAAGFGIIQMVLLFQACKMHELVGHRGLHQSYKISPSLGNVQKHSCLQRAPEWGLCEAVKARSEDQ